MSGVGSMHKQSRIRKAMRFVHSPMYGEGDLTRSLRRHPDIEIASDTIGGFCLSGSNTIRELRQIARRDVQETSLSDT